MCRDYPRVLLDHPWPELFPGCGYRVRAKGADALLEELEAAGLDDARLAELKRKLRLQ